MEFNNDKKKKKKKKIHGFISSVIYNEMNELVYVLNTKEIEHAELAKLYSKA